MNNIKKIILSLLVISLLLIGCQKKKTKIGYSVYPIKYLLDEIGGEKVESVAISDEKNIIRSQLKDDYIDILKDVDALFTVGDLEPYMELIVDDIKDYNIEVYDLGSKSSIIPFGRYTNVLVDNTEVGVLSNYYENPLFESINTYNNDPYIWLDPVIMTSMANQILAYFMENDPDNTDYYQNNFNDLKIKLAYLDANYLKLRDNQGLSFASMLPAFGMFQSNYNFLMSPVILSKYGALPTESQLEIIKVRLINDNAKYLIVEEDLDKDIKDLADELAKELDLELIYLNSLSSLSEKDKASNLDYISIMNDNLVKLEALISSNE